MVVDKSRKCWSGAGGAIRDALGAALDEGVGIPDICRSCRGLQKGEELHAESLFLTLPDEAAERGIVLGIALDPLQLQARYTHHEPCCDGAQTRCVGVPQ